MSRQRRSSLDSSANSELGARQRRESLNSAEINHQWRQFLQRNREFASNKEKTLEHKRKTKQEELDKACTFAPKVQEWSLKTEECKEEDGKICTETCAQPKAQSCFAGSSQQEIEISVNDSKHGNMEADFVSFRIRQDEVPKSIADYSENDSVTADSNGLFSINTIKPALDKSKVEAIDQNQVPEILLASTLPLEAWREEEKDGLAVVEGNPGPARLTCSPSGNLIVSNLASEARLHDAWPRARLLFADCDDMCEKRHSNVISSSASTEVSNCPSEAGAENEEDDDLDTLVANLRSHKVYSFHFSG